MTHLSEIWKDIQVDDYKVHFARHNGLIEPYDDYRLNGLNAWRVWQEHFPGSNAFNRPHIFSLMRIPGTFDQWLFGGIWQVMGTVERLDAGKLKRFYIVTLSEELQSRVGELRLLLEYKNKNPRVKLEGRYEQFIVL